MPIELETPVRAVSQAEFHEIDTVVTGLAFETQNELGRFCDEKIYQNELLYRCCDAGFQSPCKEFRIRVSHGDFEKLYRVDMLLEGCALYELKCVERLCPCARGSDVALPVAGWT